MCTHAPLGTLAASPMPACLANMLWNTLPGPGTQPSAQPATSASAANMSSSGSLCSSPMQPQATTKPPRHSRKRTTAGCSYADTTKPPALRTAGDRLQSLSMPAKQRNCACANCTVHPLSSPASRSAAAYLWPMLASCPKPCSPAVAAAPAGGAHCVLSAGARWNFAHLLSCCGPCRSTHRK